MFRQFEHSEFKYNVPRERNVFDQLMPRASENDQFKYICGQYKKSIEFPPIDKYSNSLKSRDAADGVAHLFRGQYAAQRSYDLTTLEDLKIEYANHVNIVLSLGGKYVKDLSTKTNDSDLRKLKTYFTTKTKKKQKEVDDFNHSSWWNTVGSNPTATDEITEAKKLAETYNNICMSIEKLLDLLPEIELSTYEFEQRSTSFEQLYSGTIFKYKIKIDKAEFKEKGTAVRMSSTKTWKTLLTFAGKKQEVNILRMYAWLQTVPGLAGDRVILDGKFDSDDGFPFDFLYRIGTVPKEWATKVEEYYTTYYDKLNSDQKTRLQDFQNYKYLEEGDYRYEDHIYDWSVVNSRSV